MYANESHESYESHDLLLGQHRTNSSGMHNRTPGSVAICKAFRIVVVENEYVVIVDVTLSNFIMRWSWNEDVIGGVDPATDTTGFAARSGNIGRFLGSPSSVTRGVVVVTILSYSDSEFPNRIAYYM